VTKGVFNGDWENVRRKGEASNAMKIKSIDRISACVKEAFSGEENGRCEGEGSLNLRETVNERASLYPAKIPRKNYN
jgi:hypothetical protein